MRIESVSIDVLRPYWRNPRRIDDAVEAVTRSIADYGYNSPIAVDEEFTIVVGHARYRALQRLGYEEVDVVILEDLSAQKAREYRIADNKTAEYAEWDDEKLLQEVMNIEDPTFAKRYFSDQEIADKFPTLVEEVPEDPTETAGVSPGGSPTATQASSNGSAGADSGFGADRSEDDDEENEGSGAAGAYVEAMCPECGATQMVWIEFEASVG